MAKKFLHYSKTTATFTDLAGNEFILEAITTPDSVLVIKGEDEANKLCLTPEMASQLGVVLERFNQRGVVVPPRPPKPELVVCPTCGKKKLNPHAWWVENGNEFLGSKCSTTGCGFKQHVYVLGPVKNKKPVRKCYSCFT